jgi:DNA-binding NarL/FixJ family response regulator
MVVPFEKMIVLAVAASIPLKQQIVFGLEAAKVGTIMTATHVKKAFDLCCDHRPNLVIADWDTNTVNGLDLTRDIRRMAPPPVRETPVILVTDDNVVNLGTKARDAGVNSVLLKPFSTDVLYKHVKRIINDKREFICSAAYIGPDRRRGEKSSYKGPLRRSGDKINS